MLCRNKRYFNNQYNIAGEKTRKCQRSYCTNYSWRLNIIY